MDQKRKKLQDLSVDEFMMCSFSSQDENDSIEESVSGVNLPKTKKQKKKIKTKNKTSTRNKNIKITCSYSSQNNMNDNIVESINNMPMSMQNPEKRKLKTELQTSYQKRPKYGTSKDTVEIASSEQTDIASRNKNFEIENTLGGNSKIAETSNKTDSEYSDTDEKALEVAMHKLKEKDPEFYKFLEENDKDLLEFTAADDDGNNENQQKELDESDDDDDDDACHGEETRKVNRKLIENWLAKLQQEPDLETVRKITSAFKAAVEKASGDSVESQGYQVTGNIEFNAVVQLCMEQFVPSLHKLLKLPEPSTSSSEHHFDPSKLKGWKKVCPVVKSYLSNIIKLLTIISEPAVASALLKHILYLIPFYLTFVKMSRILLKKVISFWCTGEEAVRVLAFLCIIRLVRSLQSEYLDYTLKQMYMSYVKNCKFTSPSTWPLINFMKRSLVELYSLNHSIAYQHAFIYIRQLSIHLRNAITVNKKDSYQAVYNWQYTHCLLLWMHLISILHTSSVLKPLIYPLTQTTIGTIRLIPTSKYIPLRFHLVRGLIKLSSDTDTFIPVLPLVFEALDIVDFNKKHTVLSMKPVDFSCALKLSKSQLQENGFKDAVIKNVYELLIEYLQTQASKIAFPELVLPTTIHIKSFIKKCKISNYCRKLKQLIDKVQENANTISQRRKSIRFQLSDIESVREWEKQTEQDMPLQKFYKSWKKLQNHSPEVSKKIEEETV